MSENKDKRVCTLVRALVSQYNLNALEEDALSIIEEHLTTCQECSAFYRLHTNNEHTNSIVQTADTEDGKQTLEHDSKGNESVYIRLAQRLKRRRKITIAVTAACIIVLSIILSIMFPVSTITGSCMEPTYKNGDNVMTSRIAYLLGSPKRGDVVAANMNQSLSIKRVIGLPGETIEVKDGSIFVDGNIVEVNDEKGNINSEEQMESITLGEDEYLLVNDYWMNSTDSNSSDFGRVTKENIKLKVLFHLF